MSLANAKHVYKLIPFFSNHSNDTITHITISTQSHRTVAYTDTHLQSITQTYTAINFDKQMQMFSLVRSKN